MNLNSLTLLSKNLYLNNSFVDVCRLIAKLQSKSKVAFLLGQIIVLSALEMLSIAIIVPVMKVLLDEDAQTHFTKLIKNLSGIDFELLSVKYIFVLLLILVFIIKISGIYYIYKSQINILIDIQKKMGALILKNIIGRGYQNMDREDANGTINLLNHEIDLVTNNYLLPSMMVMSECLTIILILILMIYYVGINIIIVGFCAGIFIYLVNKIINKKISKLGRERSKYSNAKLMFLRDIYGFNKELFSFNIEDLYLKKYMDANANFLNVERSQILYKGIPRLAIEFIVVFLFALCLLFVIYKNGDLNTLIPVMAMIAIALFRLIPSVNRIFGCTTNIKYSENIFQKIIKKISFLEKDKQIIVQKLSSDIQIEKIQTRNICYEAITLKNKAVNIVYGRSGIGKTTFTDIICGLVNVDCGVIRLADQIVNNFNSISVSYITQKNYFFVGTIKENLLISNQLATEYCMKNLIQKVGLESQLQERFNMEEILNCELTSIESDLSGGQYQKLAIVRGMLMAADIYVFDEPTSALDGESKKQVMSALVELAKEKMVIVISHDYEIINNGNYKFLDLEKHVKFT
jgi:ABC-type transport system involved in cytochrome bd biosynthesis fused ATPase/permease subunit